MKKFLIAVIFLIPIVVVLTLSATGQIIAIASPVNAQDLIIKDSSNFLLTNTSVITVDPFGSEVFIVIDVTPTIVHDDSITYRMDTIPGETGVVRLERQGNTNRYTIIAVESGIARIIISPKSNAGVTKAITIIVKSTAIRSLLVFNDSGEEVDSLELTSPQKLYADIYPAEAMADGQFWTSDNEKTATVTKNGTVYPEGLGATTIWANAYDKQGTLHRTPIHVDTSKALSRDTKVYSDKTPTIEWIRENMLLDKKAEVVQDSKTTFLVKLDGMEERIQVKPKSQEGWDFADCPDVIYTNNGNYFLNVRYENWDSRRTSIPAVFTSSDSLVASVMDDSLVPLSPGFVTIKAEYKGVIKTKTFEVKEKPQTFNLDLNSEDYYRGIRQTREWGYNWYVGDGLENLTNTYQFGAVISDSTDLEWSIDDPKLATIDENALITLLPECVGKSFTVTATVKTHGYLSKIKRSFTFNIVDNIKSVNVYNVHQLDQAHWKHESDAVMQSDMYLDWGIHVRFSIFGNGFKITSPIMTYAPLLIPEWNKHLMSQKIVFEDFVMEGGYDYTAESKPYSAIEVFMMPVEFEIILKNLIIERFDSAIFDHKSANVTIDGCILGDCKVSSVYGSFEMDKEDVTLTIRNTIMKNTGSASIMTIVNWIDYEHPNTNYLPNLNIEGFLDIYNWKTPDQLKQILNCLPQSTLDSIGEFIDLNRLFETVSRLMSEYFERPDKLSMSYLDTKSNQRYISMGAFLIGLVAKADLEKINIEDTAFRLLEFTLPFGEKSELGQLLSLLEIGASLAKLSLRHPSYILSYDFKGKEPRNKPGDPIPQSIEVFNKLTGYYNEL